MEREGYFRQNIDLRITGSHTTLLRILVSEVSNGHNAFNCVFVSSAHCLYRLSLALPLFIDLVMAKHVTISNTTLYIVYLNVVLYATCYQLQRPIEPFMVEKLGLNAGGSASDAQVLLLSVIKCVISSVRCMTGRVYAATVLLFGVTNDWKFVHWHAY